MSAITQEELQTAVHAALVQWGKPFDNEAAPLTELLLVQSQLAANGEQRPFDLKHAVDQLLLETIEQLAAQDETSAAVLQSRFLDGKITRQVAQEMHASIDQINRWQRTAIDALTQLIYHQEDKLRTELTQQLEASLPPSPYSQFFGFAETQQTVVAQLVHTSAPWIIVLTGIGGIGKTSLADAVVREVLPSLAFKQICWLRVESQQFSGEPQPPERAYHAMLSALAANLWPQGPHGESVAQLEMRLGQKLKAEPHLIIVDNLETTAHVDHFSRKLLAFTEPTRFLLTSRARPSGETAVYIQPLHELPFIDAEALLRHHAQVTGLAELADADADTIHAIYQVTGGNPP